MSRPEAAPTDSVGFRNSLAFRSVFVIFGWLGSLCVCLPFEWSRLQVAITGPSGVLGCFADWNPDTTLPFLVLLTFPAIVFAGVRGVRLRVIWLHLIKAAEATDSKGLTKPLRRYWLITAGMFLVSFLCSASIGWREMQIGVSAAPSELPDTRRCSGHHDVPA